MEGEIEFGEQFIKENFSKRIFITQDPLQKNSYGEHSLSRVQYTTVMISSESKQLAVDDLFRSFLRRARDQKIKKKLTSTRSDNTTHHISG